MKQSTNDRAIRHFDRARFDEAYDRVITGNRFCEVPDYYREHRPRYLRTLEYLGNVAIPKPARLLEIGGGQIALLCRELYGDEAIVADLSDEYSRSLTRHGVDFVRCDLTHDDISERNSIDLVVMCEVFEHMPIPPHIVLGKIRQWIKPGGYLFLTTPNLYRLRNVIRLALSMPLFCNFRYPEPGQSLGHPIEYSVEHVNWQIKQAGYEVVDTTVVQLMNVGSTLRTNMARKLCAPLLALRPMWRDNIVALARKPRTQSPEQGRER